MGRRWSNDARISQSQGVLRPIFAVVSPFIDRRDPPRIAGLDGLRAISLVYILSMRFYHWDCERWKAHEGSRADK